MASAFCRHADQSRGHGLTTRVNDDFGMRAEEPETSQTKGPRTFPWMNKPLLNSDYISKTFTFYELHSRKADRASICSQMGEHF